MHSAEAPPASLKKVVPLDMTQRLRLLMQMSRLAAFRDSLMTLRCRLLLFKSPRNNRAKKPQDTDELSYHQHKSKAGSSEANTLSLVWIILESGSLMISTTWTIATTESKLGE
eukprot:6367946-Amphidinium_carterae.1